MNQSLNSQLANTKPPLRRIYSGRNGGHSLFGIRMPYPGMKKTVRKISDIIKEFRGDERMRDLAIRISSSLEPDPRTGFADMRDFDGIAGKIYDWIVKNIHYIRDQNGIERIQTPDATLKLKSGDCDDMVILGSVLMESVGIPTRIKLIGEKPDEYSHIYLDYFTGGEWKPFDPTLATAAGQGIPEEMFAARKTVSIERPARSQNGTSIPLVTYPKPSRRGSHFLYS